MSILIFVIATFIFLFIAKWMIGVLERLEDKCQNKS